MSATRKTIKMKNLKNGTKTITGLTSPDMRLLAYFLELGARAMPKDSTNVQVCDAVWRFASAMRTTATYEGSIGNVEIVCETSDASVLYEDIYNL
jgi:hypothetical protein